jgi:hypothetical protein
MTTYGDRFRALVPLFLAAACFCPHAIETVSATETARAARAAVFRAAGFPTVDAPPIDDAKLAAALAGLPTDTLDSPSGLASKLSRSEHDVLVLPYGSAFPVDAWAAIRDFVREGGGLVVLGGAPFHQPVRRSGEGYALGSRQPTYARELLIGPAQETDVTAFAGPRTSVVVEAWGPPSCAPGSPRSGAVRSRRASTTRRSRWQASPGRPGRPRPASG